MQDHPTSQSRAQRSFDLSDYVVTFLHIDYRFGFDCSAGSKRNGHLQVIICKPFSLFDYEKRRVCDPETGAGIAQALNILHQPLISLTAHRTGYLVIRFANGWRLEVEPSGPYEAWEARGTGELSEILFLADAGAPLWP